LLKKRGLPAVAAFAATLALAGAAAQPAAAGFVKWEYIKFANTIFCLNDPQGNTSNGTQLNIWECNFTPNGRNQRFGFIASSVLPGTYLISLENDPTKCLADPWDSTQDGIKLEVYTCSDTAAFQWLPVPALIEPLTVLLNPNYMTFGDKNGVEKNGNPVIMWEGNGGWDQSWSLEWPLP
jgi:hypothetical protein